MPVVWRLTPPQFADALDGEGSRPLGGRWNSPGSAVLYASEHLSLCVLEVYVHMAPGQRYTLPAFEAVRISVPDDAGTTRVSTIELERLVSASDPDSACRAVGDRWLAANAHLMLAAPSVIVPEELNIMLNPAHPRMGDVTVLAKRPFRFDARLAVRWPA